MEGYFIGGCGLKLALDTVKEVLAVSLVWSDNLHAHVRVLPRPKLTIMRPNERLNINFT